MNVFQIYLCGGMTDLSYEEQTHWRLDVKDKLEHYECIHKVKCCNPVEYYSLEDSTEEIEKEAMDYDLYRLTNSNLVIANFNAPKSLGSMAEIAIAYDRKIPIIGLNEDNKELHPWSKIMCNKIFTDREDMLQYVCNYYLD